VLKLNFEAENDLLIEYLKRDHRELSLQSKSENIAIVAAELQRL